MDIDAEIEKNVEKYKEKLKKQGIDAAKLQAAAILAVIFSRFPDFLSLLLL